MLCKHWWNAEERKEISSRPGQFWAESWFFINGKVHKYCKESQDPDHIKRLRLSDKIYFGRIKIFTTRVGKKDEKKVKMLVKK